MDTIMINEDGSVSQIVSDDMLKFDGTETVRRASNVRPFHPVKRALFIVLRQLFGDKGKVSDWTRGWKGLHVAEMVDGPTLGPFENRQAALDAEVRWLLDNNLGG